MRPREPEQLFGGNPQGRRRCPPGHLLAPYRVENEEYTRALSGVGVGKRCRNGNGELD
ncbi:MAG: hypothetical protein JW889_10220 [Verrucomicrobia bacterium]|nr:hypothetical protein [Verrucomicrobiota bacterium]